MAWQSKSTYPSLSATQGRIKAFVLECYLCPTQVFFRTKTFLRKKKSFLQKLRERTDGKRKALLYDHIQSSWTAHKVSPTGLEELFSLCWKPIDSIESDFFVGLMAKALLLIVCESHEVSLLRSYQK